MAAVPGPSAAVTALALSGLPTGRFTFEGFLSVTRRERQEHLASLKSEKRTMIFYEAPPKLAQTLRDLCDAFGEERPAALCREMTKLHEEVIRCTLGEAKERFRVGEARGEFVLVVAGAPKEDKTADGAGAMERAQALFASGLSARDAVRRAAEEFRVSRSALYREFQQAKQETEE